MHRLAARRSHRQEYQLGAIAVRVLHERLIAIFFQRLVSVIMTVTVTVIGRMVHYRKRGLVPTIVLKTTTRARA